MRLIDSAAFQAAVILAVTALLAAIPALREYWRATHPYPRYTGPGAGYVFFISGAASLALFFLSASLLIYAAWPW